MAELLTASVELNVFSATGFLAKVLLSIGSKAPFPCISPALKEFFKDPSEKIADHFRQISDTRHKVALTEFCHALAILLKENANFELNKINEGWEKAKMHITEAEVEATKAFSDQNGKTAVRLEALELLSICLTLEHAQDTETQIKSWLMVVEKLYSDPKLRNIIIEAQTDPNFLQKTSNIFTRRRSSIQSKFVLIRQFLVRLQHLVMEAIDRPSPELSPLIEAICRPEQLDQKYHGFVKELLSCDGPCRVKDKKWSRDLETGLKKYYVENFELFRPIPQLRDLELSVEKNWVNLQLKGQRIESNDYIDCLEKAFESRNLAVTEGKPGIGKTMLSKRIAFDWAKGKLVQFDIVLMVRLREVLSADSLLHIALSWLQTKSVVNSGEVLEKLNGDGVLESLKILLILDGLDEWKGECEELEELLYTKESLCLSFKVLITTRPHSVCLLRCCYQSITVKGFLPKQAEEYVKKHFASLTDSNHQIEHVLNCLATNRRLRQLASTPLLLCYICIVHERLSQGTVFELYDAVIHWMVGRFEEKKLKDGTNGIICTQNGHDEQWKNLTQIQNLSRLALHGLLCHESAPQLVFCRQNMGDFEIDEICFKIGFLVKTQGTDPKKPHLTVDFIEFPHASIQEFFAAMHITNLIKENAQKLMLGQGLASLPNSCELLRIKDHIQSRLGNWRELVYTLNFVLGLTEDKMANESIKLFSSLSNCSFSSTHNSWRSVWAAAWPNASLGNVFYDIDWETYANLLQNCTPEQVTQALQLGFQARIRADGVRGIGEFVSFAQAVGYELHKVAENIVYESSTQTLLCQLDRAFDKMQLSLAPWPQAIDLFWCEGDESFVQNCLELFGRKARRMRLAVKKGEGSEERGWGIERIETEWIELRLVGMDCQLSILPWLREMVSRLQSDTFVFAGDRSANFGENEKEIWEILLKAQVSGLLVRYVQIWDLDSLINALQRNEKLKVFGLDKCQIEDEDPLRLFEAIKNSQIEQLVLSRQSLLEKGQIFKEFCEILKHWDHLTELQLSDVCMPSDFCVHLCGAIERMNGLRVLRMFYNSGMKSSDVEKLKQSKPTLCIEV